MNRKRKSAITLALVAGASLLCTAQVSWAQAPPAGDTREASIAAEQAAKATQLKPYEREKAELYVAKVQQIFMGNVVRWHPFMQSAYSGGGFTLGAGYMHHVGSYNSLDMRGSYSIKGYTRLESEFTAPRLFDRRGVFTALGGWREATQVGFYGIGTNTSVDDKTNYDFQQPYGALRLEVRPTRRWLKVAGAAEYSQWEQNPGKGSGLSVDEVYTPATLSGLGATITYLHTQAEAGFDWRTSPGFTTTGGYYGVTFHDYADADTRYGFQQIDYNLVQHVPLGRDAWVLSLHALAQTTNTKDGQAIPFFMLPSLGGGSNLRAFGSWRFRDRNSLLLQAEWRVLVNAAFDTAIFYDAGKVTPHTRDLDLDGLKHDFGIGFRLHGPTVTPIRIEIAKGNEGFHLVFTTGAAF